VIPDVRVNEQIVVREVRVIGSDGEQKGVMLLESAREMARKENLDLVEVSSSASPPVCRVMDHGKYMFERQKREKDKRKSQVRVEVKEIRLSPRTGDHDVEIALGKIQKFISEGSKVKVRVRFRGRERFNPAVGLDLLRRISGEVTEFAQLDAEPMPEGNTIIMTLSPMSTKKSPPKVAVAAGG
jgi:translation initiation factor IF-3